MNRIFLLFSLLVFICSTGLAQVRFLEGSSSISLHLNGIIIDEGGESFGLSYQHHFNRKRSLIAGLFVERIRSLTEIERIVYKQIGVVIQEEVTEYVSQDFQAYYFRLTYSELLYDINDKIYFSAGVSLRGGWESGEEREFQSGYGGLFEVDAYLSSNIAVFGTLNIEYLPIRETGIRTQLGTGFKVSF